MQAKFMVRVTWYFLPALANVGNRMLKCLYSKVSAPLAHWGPVAQLTVVLELTWGLYMPDPKNMENTSSCQSWVVTAAS